jgi:hypothetical protein
VSNIINQISETHSKSETIERNKTWEKRIQQFTKEPVAQVYQQQTPTAKTAVADRSTKHSTTLKSQSSVAS